MGENDRAARNNLDVFTTSITKQYEKYGWWDWWLYGLNDCLRDVSQRDDTHALFGSKYPPLSRKYNWSSRCIYKNNNSLSPDKIHIKLKKTSHL